MKRLAEQTLYEILEVPPDASTEAIEAAVERARLMYGPGALATYSLLSPEESALLARRIEEARETLLDPELRPIYDEELGKAAAPPNGAVHAPAVAPWPPPVIPPARSMPLPEPEESEEDEEDDDEAEETPSGSGAPERACEEPVRANAEAPAAEERTAPAAPAPAEAAAADVAAFAITVEPPPPERADASGTPPGGPAVAPPPPPAAPTPILLSREVTVPAATPPPVAGATMTPVPMVPQPMPPPVPDQTLWTGEVLRQIREARGITLQQLAERTKVTRHHIENIEADRYGLLPAPVYLRGILMSVARELRLDGQKVARSYLERFTAGAAPPAPTRTR